MITKNKCRKSKKRNKIARITKRWQITGANHLPRGLGSLSQFLYKDLLDYYMHICKEMTVIEKKK